ncbi:MAG TPA: tyrosine--tRNA ligase [Allosphingosinicella sp.]|nr:tyrosine--tRNA ligase [Allosphingosinicella sp.]
MGGSDQWGNITAGIDLIRKVSRSKAYGVVFPLVTTSSGLKFGKTEAGAVWLSANKTSPFEFYQFWINVDDRDVGSYLRYFTWLSPDEIDAIEESHACAPERREAQRCLAREVTSVVHGESVERQAEKISDILFGGQLESLTSEELSAIVDDLPASTLDRAVLAEGMRLVDACLSSGLCASKGEARRLAGGGGLYLNGTRITDPERLLTTDDLVLNSLLVLKKGSKDYRLIRIGGSA